MSVHLEANTRFGSSAKNYAEMAFIQRDLAQWLGAWLENREASEGLHALELGAGSGFFTKKLTDRFAHLTAMDAAAGMLAAGKLNVPEADWLAGDAWELQCDRVDRLYSASLLQWCPQPQAVLSSWAEKMKEGARMLHGFYVIPLLHEWEKFGKAWSPIQWRSEREWLDCFKAAGFRVLRSEQDLRSYYFADTLELLRHLRCIGATGAPRANPMELRAAIKHCDAALGPDGLKVSWNFFRVECEIRN